MLKAQSAGQLFRHIPVAHQPGTDLLAGDAQQVLLDMPGRQVRVDLQVTADQREVRWEHVRQDQVTEVVQQTGQVGQAGFRALRARHGAGQALDHCSGIDRLLPVRGGVLRLILGQAQSLAQCQAESQVDHQVEAQHADDGVFHRANLAGRGVVGRGCPADHLCRQCRVGFDHAGDVVHRGIGVNAQLDDLLRGFRQRRNLDGFFQALLDAACGKSLHGLGDFRAVIMRAIKVRFDRADRLTETRRAGLAQQRLEGFGGDFQQHTRLAGLDQQTGHLQQAFFVEAGRTGQRRQTGQCGQIVLAEHALQAFRFDRRELAPSQFGQARKIEHVATRIEHQQGTDGVVHQHGLQARLAWLTWALRAYLIGYGEFLQQLHDHGGGLRIGVGGEGGFSHIDIQR